MIFRVLPRSYRGLFALSLGVFSALVLLCACYWMAPQIIGGTDVGNSGRWNALLADARRIDVNAASTQDLERLPGVGPVLAARIVAYRDRHGPFQQAEELERVAGVGPITLERIMPLLGVD